MNSLKRTYSAAALAFLLLPGLLLAASPRIAGAAEYANTREYLRAMDAKYKDVVSDPTADLEKLGIAQYERYKWFVEPRLDDITGNEPLGARLKAFDQLKQMEQNYGSRSNTWFNDGPINVSGRCLVIAVHPTNPQIVYAGFASSGIWKTTDGGTTWTPLGDGFPSMAVSCIKIDPSNPNRIWIGTGEGWGNTDAVHGAGLLESLDAGATWNTTGFSYNVSQGLDTYAVDYNPATGTLIVAADNGLWRSTDGGATFTQLYTYGPWKDLKMKIGSTTTWFATTHGWNGFGFYVSNDDGSTWNLVTNGVPATVTNNKFALTPADPNTIYWANNNGDGTMSIYKSTDGAASFTDVYDGSQYGSQGWYDISLAVDPTNPNIVYSGGVYYYRSTNGGVTFNGWGGNIHVDHHASAWAPSDHTNFWEGSDGGVWHSTNSGNSFMDANTGLATLQFYAVNHADSRATRASGGAQDNGSWRYDNNPNWVGILGGDGFFTNFDRQHPDTLYAESQYGAHARSYDGGAHMNSIMGGITDGGPWSTPFHVDYSNSAIVWTAHNTKIWKSTNRGTNWVWTNNPTGLGGGVFIDQCRAVPNEVVVVSGSKVWVTTDAGGTWADRTSGMVTGNHMSGVGVDPNDPNTMVVTVSTYSTTTHQIQKTTDGGATWSPLDASLPDEPVNTIAIDPSNPTNYFIGTDNSVYVSQDAGTTWQPFNTGLPYVVVDQLRIHDSGRLLRAGTHGRGLWECDITSLGPTAVNQPHPTVQPLALRVFGSPTRDTAILHFGLRQAGQVNLSLYDLQGRLVRTYLNSFHYAYVDNVTINVKDLPAGVYFARLQANGAQATAKVVVER